MPAHHHNNSVQQPFTPINIPPSRQRAVFWHTTDRLSGHQIRIADWQGNARCRPFCSRRKDAAPFVPPFAHVAFTDIVASGPDVGMWVT
jgi:hypothetical protein